VHAVDDSIGDIKPGVLDGGTNDQDAVPFEYDIQCVEMAAGT